MRVSLLCVLAPPAESCCKHSVSRPSVVWPAVRATAPLPDFVRDTVDTRAGAHRNTNPTRRLCRCSRRPPLPGVSRSDTSLKTLAGERTSSSPVSIPTDGFGAATGAVFRIDLDNGEAPQPGSGVMRFPADSSFDLAAAVSSVGSAATDRSVIRDGRTVRITGSYSWDALHKFEGSVLGES